MESVFERQLDLAGIPTSVVASDFTRLAVSVPRHMEISDRSLVYDPANCERKRISRSARPLEVFTGLWKQEDADIYRFASHFGVLELDADGNPLKDYGRYAVLWGSLTPSEIIGREPLARWREYSRMFSALLAISAKLHQGERGRADEWNLACPNEWKSRKIPLFPTKEIAGRDTKAQKLYVELIVAGLVLEKSSLHPVLKWSGERVAEPGIVFGFFGAGLFSALLFHLMLAITRVNGLAICGACQRSFTPAAKARRGNTRFCDDCRKDGSAHRVAVRNYSKRKKLGEGEHGKKTR